MSKPQPRQTILFALRFLTLAILAVVALSGRPPAGAQMHSDQTMYDAMQDQRMIGIEKSADAAHEAYKGQWTAVNTLQQTVSGLQGEERGVAGFLVILQIAQIVLGIRGNKKGEAA